MNDLSWVLAYRSEELTIFFRLLSMLGEEVFLMVIMAIGYWCINKKLYRDMVVMVCVCGLVNVFLKSLFMVPRPTVEYLASVNDLYSFPSGHAQVVTVFWLMLAIHYKRALLWWGSMALIVGACMSRVYLGVHFPADVGVGVIVGAMLVVGYELLRNSLYWSIFSRKKSAMAMIFFSFLGLYFFYMIGENTKTSVVAGGALLGVLVGHLMENKYCRYHTPSQYSVRIFISILGLGSVFLLKEVLKLMGPAGEVGPYLFMMYSAIGFYMVYIVPLIIKKISVRYDGEGDRLGALVES